MSLLPNLRTRVILIVAAGAVGALTLIPVGQGVAKHHEGSVAKFNSGGSLLRPEGYREWVFVGTPLTPNDMNGGMAPFPEFHAVYIDPGSLAGIWTGPPLALGQPNPMSSINMTTTLGAPFGGRRGLIGGNVASRASIALVPLTGTSGIGRISRSIFGSCSISKLLSFQIYIWPVINQCCSRMVSGT